jgi:hypothetical protein
VAIEKDQERGKRMNHEQEIAKSQTVFHCRERFVSVNQALLLDAHERLQPGDFLRQAGIISRVDHIADILVGPGPFSRLRKNPPFIL